MGGINLGDEVAEDVHFLGEFGVGPVVVLVVIFDDELYATLGGVGDAGLNAVGGVADAIGAGDFGAALAGEDAAELGAEGGGHVDPFFFLVDLLLAESGVGVGEIGGAAKHGDGEAEIGGGFFDFGEALG